MTRRRMDRMPESKLRIVALSNSGGDSRPPFTFTVLVLFAIVAPALSTRADTIVFRTGERLRGTVVAEQPSSVIFDSEALGRIEIPRERIERLDREAAAPAAPEAQGEARPAPMNAATNHPAGSRDFLRFYTDHGVHYEFVQPVRVAHPLGERTNVFSENISVRGRLGFRGSFDAAGYLSSQGQQEVDADAEVRSFRLYTTGEFGVLRTNHFKLDLGLAGGEFYLHDASLRWPQVPYAGNVTFGYFAVPQTIENIIPFGANAFMEAGSPGLAFSPGHRVGIQLDRAFLNERMTASLGFFSVGQKASLNFGDASDSLARPTLRLTGLLMDQPDQHRLLHLGGSASFVFSDSSDIRYQARPESHLAPILVGTGPLDARFAYVGGLEAIYQHGPFTLQSEIMGSALDADQNHIFWGGYVSAGWLLTGEQRSYDRALGAPGKSRPTSPLSLKHHGWGALELALRYSYLDLNDGAVSGGRMNILMPGASWYWSEHVRWQFNYGFAHVAEGPSPGNLHTFQSRLQLNY